MTPPEEDPFQSPEHALKRAWRHSKLYDMSLRAPMPDVLSVKPVDPWAGDTVIADSLFKGHFRFAGHTVLVTGSPFDVVPPSLQWAEELSSFVWLRHFGAYDGEASNSFVHRLVSDWLERYSSYDDLTWQPHVLGQRMMAWSWHQRTVYRRSELVYRSRVLHAMARQSLHLSRTIHLAPEGPKQLTSALGLAFAAVCLPDRGKWLGRALSIFGKALPAQIGENGFHRSRNPLDQVAVLNDCIALRALLKDAEQPMPEAITRMIPIMTSALNQQRLGDMGLVCMNGAYEGRKRLIAQTIKLAGPPIATPAANGPSKPNYLKMQNGRTMVVADFGHPPKGQWARLAHAGALSFEMSVGRYRLICNCGGGDRMGDEWRDGMRVTAAHSTLVLEDSSSSGFANDLATSKDPLSHRATIFDVGNAEENGDRVVTAAHSGYAEPFGFNHRRTLFLNAAGSDLRGEDTLERSVPRRDGDLPRHAAIRFHLHPDVEAIALNDKQALLLRLPSGEGWIFRASGVELGLEETVYVGDASGARPAQQIVLSFDVTDAGRLIRWAFKVTA